MDAPGASDTKACGIDGSNIVGSYYDSAGLQHGFLYDGITWTTLDKPGASGTYLDGISGNTIIGHYVVAGQFYIGGAWRSEARYNCVYNGATWTTLDKPGSLITWASGIDGNNIVGSYSDVMPNPGHGFVYDGATWTSLDKPGAGSTDARDIDGKNIVGCYNPAGGGGTRGFLYDGASWTTLDAPAASGLFGTIAWGIDGSRIVGQYYSAERGPGQYSAHGFVYDTTPVPEPSSIIALAGGLVGSLTLRRRTA